MGRQILLEVCVGSLQDALTAQEGGADRIELNNALSLGGLTPSFGTVNLVRQQVQLPLIVMLRPREGGFCYSEAEFQTMRADLDSLLESNVDGMAFGVLHSDRTVDLPRCRDLIHRLGSKQPVFHRAFDLTPDPLRALEELIDLGCHRILTSGQGPTAIKGADLLKQLIQQARGRIEILPGAGIRSGNVRELLQAVPATQIHSSLSSERFDPSLPLNCSIHFSTRTDGMYISTDLAKVREMRKMLDSITELVEDELV